VRRETLGICIALGNLLDATMDVSAMGIDLLDGLAIKDGLQAEHTVSGRMLRADIDHVVVICKEGLLLGYQFAFVVQAILHGVVGFGVIEHRGLILFGIHVEVLAQGITLEVATQVETAHIGMAQELDAQEVVDFAFKQFGSLPQVAHGGQISVVAVFGNSLD
jgi:hypothetical protein